MKQKLLALFLVMTCVWGCKKSSPSGKDSPPKIEQSDVNQTSPGFSGTIDGAGGGDFVRSEFWYFVEQIKQRIEMKDTQNLLNDEQIENLKTLMSETLVTLEFSNEPLYEILESGEKRSVMALNYPSIKKIKLSIPFWRERLDRKLEVRHLILHEFLGLAEITDVNYAISSRYYSPPSKIFMYQSKAARCMLNGLTLDTEDLGRVGLYGATGKGEDGLMSVEVLFGDEVEVKNSMCRNGKECKNDAYKSIQTSLMFRNINNYRVDLVMNVYRESYLYGWGGARGRQYVLPAEADLSAKLIYMGNGEEEVHGIVAKRFSYHEIRQAVLGERLSLTINLQNTSFHSKLHKYGVDLVRHSKSNVQRSPFNQTNLVNLLTDWVEEYEESNPAGSGWKEIFGELGKKTVVSASVECTFIK